MFVVLLVEWAFEAHHVPDGLEVHLAAGAIGHRLLVAAYVWLLYLALEPYVRRRWPSTIVSWTRLVGGRVRDPLVGRDVLIGLAWGSATAGLASLVSAVTPRLGLPAPLPKVISSLDPLLGWPETMATALGFQTTAVAWGMGLLLVAAIVRGTGEHTRRGMFVAIAVSTAAMAAPTMVMFQDTQWLGVFLCLAVSMTAVFVLVRAGLLAAIVGFYVGPLFDMPLTTRLDEWSAGPTLFLLAFLTGAAVASARTALAGRPLLPSTTD